jgi:hypothetical protein
MKLLGNMRGMLFRSGYEYIPTDRNDSWDGKQYEFTEDGKNHIVKDGVTYRQGDYRPEARGANWGSPRPFNSRTNVSLQRQARKRKRR